jgi:hypothetical protein
MATTIQAMPKFRKGQQVCFLGGEGIIQNYHPEAGRWFYAVEMAPEPNFGRIGGEATILMLENDITLTEEWIFESSYKSVQNSLVMA